MRVRSWRAVNSPLVASRSVAEIALAGADVQIPPAVYTEVVIRGGARPDALTAARLIQTGYIQLVDTTVIGSPLEDLQHYQLGQGESEALTLTAHLGAGTVTVTDDFLALIIAHRLGVSCQLFLGFVIGRAARGELPLIEAQQIVHAVSPRYPVGFVPHSLTMLRRQCLDINYVFKHASLYPEKALYDLRPQDCA